MMGAMSEREKIFVVAGVACILVTLLWLGILSPYQAAVAQSESRIESRQRQLQELQALQQEYQQLNQELAAAEKRLVAHSRNFSLFSFIEEVTNRTGVRDKLVSMRPQPSSNQGEYREESVEIRMEKLQLDQLVRLLHAMDSADVFLTVKSLRIKPRFDNQSLLDTALVVSYYQRTT